MKEKKQVVLSGIRATGKLHLGNHLGVLERFAELSQDPQYQCYFFVADLHTLTTYKEGQLIKEHLPDIILDFLAAGVDPQSSILYAQSSIPEIAELMWYLCCLTPTGELEKLPTYKDKSEKQIEKGDFINAGLLNYPVLMAADILGPKANQVPVGADQLPHLELAQEIAKRFNRLFGQTFPFPDAMVGEAIMVPGLDGTGKMGKSEANTINLTDSAEMIETKIKTAVTDPDRKRRRDPGNPQVCNIYKLHCLMSSNEEIKQVAQGCFEAKIGCVDCKEILIKHVEDLLLPFQERRVVLAQKPNLVSELLVEGGKKARQVISATVAEVREKMGIIRY